MSSIYDIPYEDIAIFLSANNKNIENEEDAYNIASILLKDKKAVGHTINIIEWMIAHNLLLRKINIPNYSIHEINKMSQIEINQLAKSLTMKKHNIENIKNILRYLDKLDDEDTELIYDINDTILQTLNELEISMINFKVLEPDAIINLLKTHRNKALIRKQIYNNIEEIIFHNFIDVDIERFDDLIYIEDLTYQLPKYMILKLINNYEERLKEINSLINYSEENRLGIINSRISKKIWKD